MTGDAVPAVEGWFTIDEAAPQLVGARGKESGSLLLADRDRDVGQPRARRARSANRSLLSRRARLWSWTTNHYAPPEPYVAPDPFVPYTVCAVELDARTDGGARTARDRRRRRAASKSACRWSWCSVRSTRTTSTSTSCGNGRRWQRLGQWRRTMTADHDIAVLGVGMHPWGKWGRNFVEYGVVAAQAALADAGRCVVRHPVRVGRRDRCATAIPATSRARRSRRRSGWNGAQVASSYAACASGVTALVDRARPDPRRIVRRGPRDRRRHHAEGFPRTEQGRARRRSRLVAVPAARRDEPDLLRAVRTPAHGAVRRDARGLRAASR